MNRLATTAETNRMGAGEGFVPQSAMRPFSLLALLDTTQIGRRNLLGGLFMGQLLVSLSHGGLLLSLWAVASPSLLFFCVGLFFWLLVAVAALALAVVLSRLISNPRWAHAIGWSVYLGILLSSMAIRWAPDGRQVFIWAWPFTGLVVAFRRILDPAVSVTGALEPFFTALVAVVVFWWIADRFFDRRSAVWQKRSSVG
jgi:hypothetical protein